MTFTATTLEASAKNETSAPRPVEKWNKLELIEEVRQLRAAVAIYRHLAVGASYSDQAQ